MTWIYILISAAISATICYIIMRPRHKLDKEIIEINIANKKEMNDLTKECAQLKTDRAALEAENKALVTQRADLMTNISQITDESKAKAQEIYDFAYDAMQEKLSQSAEEAAIKYLEGEKTLRDIYLSMLEDSAKQYQEKLNEISEANDTLENMKAKISAAIEEEKRRLADENKKDFYKIHISKSQLWDIRVLKEAIQELKGDGTAINKVIWEVYYKRPTTELLNRVTPSGKTFVGIYKITNLNNNQCYIGQSVDIRSRLRDHIKAGLGINTSNNRFYSNMKEFGPEQFMYEVIEECDRSKLNERERFWIDFFKGAEYGYNATQGNGDRYDS